MCDIVTVFSFQNDELVKRYTNFFAIIVQTIEMHWQEFWTNFPNYRKLGRSKKITNRFSFF